MVAWNPGVGVGAEAGLSWGKGAVFARLLQVSWAGPLSTPNQKKQPCPLFRTMPAPPRLISSAGAPSLQLCVWLIPPCVKHQGGPTSPPPHTVALHEPAQLGPAAAPAQVEESVLGDWPS